MNSHFFPLALVAMQLSGKNSIPACVSNGYWNAGSDFR